MSTTNGDVLKQAAIKKISEINEVVGFDPTPLAVDYTDLSSNKTEKRLPVMIQMAWFRLKYPEGKIAVSVKPGKDYFEAHARVYAHYNDPVDCYLAEASTSRKHDPANPTVSPREWAQTAAIGVALRNAGFGLQFKAAGDSFDFDAVNELDGVTEDTTVTSVDETVEPTAIQGAAANDETGEPDEQQQQSESPAEEDEDPLAKAMKVPCPIGKYNDKTLGDLVGLDPKALAYIAKSTTYDSAIVAAAKFICEDALANVS